MSIRRHIKLIIIFLLFFCCNNFLVAAEEGPEEEFPNFLISEIFYYFRDKDGKNNKGGEWIEIYNEKNLELSSTGKSGDKYKFDLRLCDRGEKEECENDHPIYYKKDKLELDKGEIFIIARDDDFFEKNHEDYKGKILQSSFDLTSSKDPNFVGIFFENDDKENWLDEVEYQENWGGNGNGKSIERKKCDEKNEKENWTESFFLGGTPGKKYEKYEIEYSKQIVINELLPDPEGSDTDNEWIEIKNLGDKKVDLTGWKIEDKSGKGYILNKEIEKTSFLIVKRSDSKVSLNNDKEEIILLNPSNEKTDSVSYKEALEGFSWARNKDGNFSWTNLITPGKENEFLEDLVFPDGAYLNEIMSNPDGKDDDKEWIEFFNENNKEIDLDGWTLENSSGKNFVIKNFIIQSGEYKVLELKNTSFYIKNSEEMLSFYNPKKELIEKIDLSGKSLSGASYSKTPNKDWRWSRFATPGNKNRINNPPKIEIKKDDDFYVDVYGNFDATQTSDKDKDELKFKWDFGDGHRSYKETARHRYEKEGKYLVQLFVSDGSEEVLKEFKIEVNKYPRKEIEIVELMPNPAGKDSGAEYIILKNNSSKRVNLKDWKIATGRDKEHLVNHPIYEDFVIESGKEKKIKRDKSKFSLLNQKCAVALKYPDDEIADMVKYEKEKILEDEKYVLINNVWTWILPDDFNSLQENQDFFINNSQIKIKGVSFSKKILEVFYNDKLKTTEKLKQVKFENWVNRNKPWLELGGLILFLKKV